MRATLRRVLRFAHFYAVRNAIGGRGEGDEEAGKKRFNASKSPLDRAVEGTLW